MIRHKNTESWIHDPQDMPVHFGEPATTIQLLLLPPAGIGK